MNSNVMQKFLINTLILVAIVLGLSALLLFLGLYLSESRLRILPKDSGSVLWQGNVEPPEPEGLTRTNLKHAEDWVDIDFIASSEQSYPYVGYHFNFMDDSGQRIARDLSKYERINFEVSCEPRTILLLVLFTIDSKKTVLADPDSYRMNLHFFTCNEKPQRHSFTLDDFDTPDWWLQSSGLELVDRNYDLTQVVSFGVANSLQTPKDTLTKVKVSNVVFKGRSKTVITITVLLIIAIWIATIVFLLRKYIRVCVEIAKTKMQQDLPLIAYQKISIAPQKDRAKSELLTYLATEYSNPELSVDQVVTTLGMNRNKVNEILKDELGLTFTAYINKLRLTEAARLLSVYPDESIAQIAYKVGFNNVTYFNKLFKSTYGCSPKQFKDSNKEGG